MTTHSAYLRRLAVAAIAASALGLAGCDDTTTEQKKNAESSTHASGEKGATQETVVVTSTRTISRSNTTTAPQQTAQLHSGTPENSTSILGTPDTSDKQQQPDHGALVPIGIRVASHDTFDRIVIDLEGTGTPGWASQLTTEPTQLTSGEVITFNGTQALLLNITGTLYPFELGIKDPNLNADIDPTSTGVVTEVRSLGTFEGSSQFLIGLDRTHPYSIQSLSNPNRLVIDIQH
ncbi:hypothetical protein EML15_05875 [Corynebacterium sp. sy017]|uniref:AMIN-like domain-containing (lipo)protein n=1 Tax=unclassified Corynebacterium TaxID=2624378 RepID=UPI0011855FF6|nr:MULTISPECIES: hypothetical protein [unclassified Corynebacterium]MBP3088676.1 hypothetical protein [Corynebacterium sp. sy017]TSD91965.1 hypothetical protein ELY17_05875 [Corynebacterium sp. SY003]